MTNEELKEKIVKELNKLQDYGYMCRVTYNESTGEGCGISHQVTNERIADALIAAGIGDVKEAEAEANRYEMLYKLQNKDMALAERRAHDAEHRAERAEKALEKFAENITCEDCPYFSDCASSEKMEDLIHSDYCFAEYLRQAEKELAEEGKE